ncbi:unnamed protein product [Symbiodinium natans]|uniref:Uncharacterized protein n=1 Tax=Symbiodinium natans TaxID=878477 RepID=A0A812QU81_9DINO|nr:unnamed protein product [Symbiodinium natans]
MEYEDVRFLDPATGAVKPTKFPFIYPDTLACSIWHLGEEYFRYFFLGNQDAGAFWQHVAGTSWAKPALEALPAGIDRGKLIPVSFYGDDVHTYKATECGVISILAWTTDYLTAMHPSFHRYFLIAGFSEYLQCVHTWPDIMERLVERFTRLVSDANWPWCAKGYKFHMSSCTGDLKWIKERFQVFDYNANDFCAYCSARKIDPDCPSNTLSDFRETAAHRRHRFGHDDFLATTPAAESILPDTRSFPYLASDMSGFSTTLSMGSSMLVYLCERGFFGPMTGDYEKALAAGLSAAYKSFMAWNKQHGQSVLHPRFTPARLCRKGRTQFPCLNAKGAASKRISFWLAAVGTEFASRPGATLLDKTCATCMVSYVEFLRTLDAADLLLDARTAKKAYDLGTLHLNTYSSLRQLSSRTFGYKAVNRSCWALLPKHHYFLHMCTDTIMRDGLNPRFQTLFAGESFIGEVGRIARAPLSIDDPIAYHFAEGALVMLWLGTLWNVAKRDHALISTMFYHETFTRPQRLQCFIALLTGLLAVNAAVHSHPGTIQEAKEFIITGLLSGLLVFPVFCGLVMMFNLRPAQVKKRLIKRAYSTKEIDKLNEQRQRLANQSSAAKGLQVYMRLGVGWAGGGAVGSVGGGGRGRALMLRG